MRIYIDDGSTHIKMLWEQHGKTVTHISPNSFKRGWSATFGNGKPFTIKQAIHSGIARYRARVLEAVDRFKGYTYVAVVGGGACLLADAIRTHVNLREDRFFVAQDPQFALVHGLKAIG